VLGALGGLLQALERHPVVAQVDAVCSMNRLASQSMIRWSKSSPPRKVSPLVLAPRTRRRSARGC
jgi:hypothetical protein